MEGIRLYKQLLQHPLFQGMSNDDLGKVIAQTKFDFRTYNTHQLIVKEYDPCKHVLFLLDGTISIEGASDDRSYRIIEQATSPWLLPVENLFGLHQHYTRTYKAVSLCHIVAIDKTEVLHLTEQFVVFRFNLLNILSATAQKKERDRWQPVPKTLQGRIAQFLISHCLTPYGNKTFHIKMTHLANELNDSRLDISRALNKMQEQQLLTLRRGRIVISEMETLYSL